MCLFPPTPSFLTFPAWNSTTCVFFSPLINSKCPTPYFEICRHAPSLGTIFRCGRCNTLILQANLGFPHYHGCFDVIHSRSVSNGVSSGSVPVLWSILQSCIVVSNINIDREGVPHASQRRSSGPGDALRVLNRTCDEPCSHPRNFRFFI